MKCSAASHCFAAATKSTGIALTVSGGLCNLLVVAEDLNAIRLDATKNNLRLFLTEHSKQASDMRRSGAGNRSGDSNFSLPFAVSQIINRFRPLIIRYKLCIYDQD